MSLEAALKENTEAANRMTEALNAVLAGAGVTGAKAKATPAAAADETIGAGEEKAAPKAKAAPKTKANAKAKADGGDEITFDTLKADCGKWLAEFADGNNVDHPEIEARKTELKVILGKLGVEKLGELSGNDKDIARLHTWLHGKARTQDLGFGPGRYSADPEDTDDDADGDDDDL